MRDQWQIPQLSVLTGTDKDALQSIFRSLQAEVERLNSRITDLERAAMSPKGFREQKGY
jgi:uncharacterized protein YlxW (UPF0749 family)